MEEGADTVVNLPRSGYHRVSFDKVSEKLLVEVGDTTVSLTGDLRARVALKALSTSPISETVS